MSEYSVRPGTREDIADAVPLIEEFVAESIAEYGLTLSVDHALGAFVRFVNNSLVMIKDSKIIGVLAGTLAVHPLTGKQIFQEQVWFVSKPHRRYGIKLIRTLEANLIKLGVDKLIMGYMANSKSDKLHGFYETMGFRFLEAHFIKDLVQNEKTT